MEHTNLQFPLQWEIPFPTDPEPLPTAVFQDMFGDPLDRPEPFPEFKISDLPPAPAPAPAPDQIIVQEPTPQQLPQLPLPVAMPVLQLASDDIVGNRFANRFAKYKLSEERPYKCLKCDKGFFRSDNLAYHMNNVHHPSVEYGKALERLHSGGAGFDKHLCHICGSKFTGHMQRSNWVRHMRSKHNIQFRRTKH